MSVDQKPYEPGVLERRSFSELSELIRSASGPAIDAIERFLLDLQAANELALDRLALEDVRFVLARIGDLRGAVAYRRLELAAAAIEAEAYRLIEVSKAHRATMLRELDDPDTKRQRGNAAAYAHVDGTVGGLAHALRQLGFEAGADRVDYSRDQPWAVADLRP